MPKDYNISKVTGRCAACERELAPGEGYVATVIEQGEELQRHDYCPECWDAWGGDSTPLGQWRARVPEPNEKKKLFVDDDVLINFFERLAGAEDPAKVNFRFVLALILMRKKRLIYDRSRTDPHGREVWQMHLRGSDETCEVVDPNLDEEKIAEVGDQLHQIMEIEE